LLESLHALITKSPRTIEALDPKVARRRELAAARQAAFRERRKAEKEAHRGHQQRDGDR